jgi:hypothetical protein
MVAGLASAIGSAATGGALRIAVDPVAGVSNPPIRKEACCFQVYGPA